LPLNATIKSPVTKSALQYRRNPHEHWICGVDADGQNSQEQVQWESVSGSFGAAPDDH
jgi:hypothetical protein